MKRIFTLFVILFSVLITCANHMSGGKIEYRFVDSNTVEVTVVIYKGCTGIAPSDLDLYARPCSNTPLTIKPFKVYSSQTNGNCLSCSGDDIRFGFRKLTFVYLVDISAYSNCCSWLFYVDLCCRNGVITTGSASTNFHLQAEMDICNLRINNSVHFMNDPVFNVVVRKDNEIYYRLATQDTTTDSLSFDLVEPYSNINTTIKYTGSYSPQGPLTYLGFPRYNFAFPAGFNIDKVRGVIRFRPMIVNQVTVFTIKVTKFTKINGVYVKVGTVMMEHLVIVYPTKTPVFTYPEFLIYTGADQYQLGDSGTNKKFLDLCHNDSLVLRIPIPQDYRFQWFRNNDSIPGATGNRLVVRDTGTYKVKVYLDSVCYQFSDPLIVWSPPKNTARISLDSTLALCKGEPVPIRSKYPLYTSFTWYSDTIPVDSSIIDSLMITGKGNYRLEVIDTGTCIVISNVLSPVFHEVKMDLVSEDSLRFCDKINVTLNAANGLHHYRWSNGDTLSSSLITAPGLYRLEARDSNRCLQTDSILTQRIISPQFDLGNDTLICDGNIVDVKLNAGSDTNWVYRWNDVEADSFNMYQVNDTGLYFVKVTAEGLCTTHDTIVIKRTPLPVFSLGNDTSFCIEGAHGFVLNAPFHSEWKYQWQDGIGKSNNYIITDTGLYILEVTDKHVCKFKDSLQVDYHPLASLQKISDTGICANENIAYLVQAVTNAMHYQWNNSAKDTFRTYIVKDTGLHRIRVRDANQCTRTDSFRVFHKAVPVVFIGNDTQFCQQSAITFALQNKLDNGYTYVWQNDPPTTVNNYMISDTGKYRVRARNNDGCEQGDEIRITHYPVKQFAMHDTFTCDGKTIQLIAPLGFYKYRWSTGLQDTAVSIAVNTPGNITLEASDEHNCPYKSSFNVGAYSYPFFSLEDTLLCEDGFVLFDLQNIDAQITWHDGSTLKQFEMKRPGVLFASAANLCGVHKDSAQVKICFPEIYIPNIFTPNGDQLNETFKVQGNVKVKEFIILNRWGQIVFSSQDRDMGWNGTYEGAPCPDGMYVYYVLYQDALNRYNNVKGMVQLMR